STLWSRFFKLGGEGCRVRCAVKRKRRYLVYCDCDCDCDCAGTAASLARRAMLARGIRGIIQQPPPAWALLY
ncbi:MAG: hypothetical protein RXR52_35145, partial [Paraburkholderia sp.]|uniref:hypothetical protein n=1 Tax=Paraburkholderia sp. TaxID=1926495 RepID=UPI00397D980D